MRQVWIYLTALLLLMPGVSQPNDIPIMTTDQLERGMKGTGKTVFQGTKIEEFNVEILGVLKNVWPKGDLIIARLSGGPLEKTGVIAGMSGSPIYVDGKLIGAVAYGWSFPKEPICGITPIADMMDVFDKSLEKDEESLGDSFGGFPQEIAVQLPEGLALTNSQSMLKPLGTPLALTGFDQRVVERMSPQLERFGFIPIQGGASSEEDQADAPLASGSALGVQLLRGDLSATGIGTLTYRDGDRVVAFGHSMFLSGSTDIPMTGAFVYDVFPSQIWSFKFCSATGLLGTITQDRRAAVAGLIGRMPDMIPISVQMSEEKYNFQVLRNRYFGPYFAMYAIYSVISSAEKLFGDATVRVKSQIEIEGHPKLERENLYSGEWALSQTAFSLASPIYAIVQNPFEKVRIKDISFDIAVQERIEAAWIQGIRVDKRVVRPGDSIQVTIFLRKYLGESLKEKASLRIPEDTPDGDIVLRVSDARSSKGWEMRRAPDKYVPRDFPQLLEILSSEEQNDNLIIELFLPRRSLTVEGKEMPSLPTSLLSVMGSLRQIGQTGPVTGSIIVRERINTNFVISGSHTTSIEVNRKAK